MTTGETQILTLPHDLDKVRTFYQAMPPATVGIKATGKAIRFANLCAKTAPLLLVGNPALIRKRATSRHTSDKRDAELIFNLLGKDELPATPAARSGEPSNLGDFENAPEFSAGAHQN